MAKGSFEAFDDPLGQRCSLHELRTTFGQHGELIAAQVAPGVIPGSNTGLKRLATALSSWSPVGVPKAVR